MPATPLRLTQVCPGVHRLATRYWNWYLLEAGGRLTVLDTGLPGDWREFSSVLSRLGHTLDDIDAVLITHHHPDHTAGSCALFLEDRSLLFSGDALVTLDVTYGRTGPQIIRGAWTEDAELAMHSLDALAAANADTVLPGHGEPWSQGVNSAVDIARQVPS